MCYISGYVLLLLFTRTLAIKITPMRKSARCLQTYIVWEFQMGAVVYLASLNSNQLFLTFASKLPDNADYSWDT